MEVPYEEQTNKKDGGGKIEELNRLVKELEEKIAQCCEREEFEQAGGWSHARLVY